MLVLGCTYIFPSQFTQKLKTGILNVVLGWTFQFFTNDERDKKLEFSRLGLIRDSLVDHSMLFPHLYLT